MRNPDCRKYMECLAAAALKNRNFQCDACPEIDVAHIDDGFQKYEHELTKEVAMSETGTKVCRKCGKEKELKKFPKAAGSPDGREGQCYQCKNELTKEREKLKAQGLWVDGRKKNGGKPGMGKEKKPEVGSQKSEVRASKALDAGEVVITVDFKKCPDLLQGVIEEAEAEDRPLAWQIIHILKNRRAA